VLAKPLPQDVLARYLQEALDRGGEEAVRRAARVLGAVDASPLDSQRVFVHSRLGKTRLLSLASFVWPDEFGRFKPRAAAENGATRHDEIQWIAVWSDFKPSNEAEQRLAQRVGNAAPVEILERGGAAVRIYHLE
jgi:hypothetical protein